MSKGRLYVCISTYARMALYGLAAYYGLAILFSELRSVGLNNFYRFSIFILYFNITVIISSLFGLNFSMSLDFSGG